MDISVIADTVTVAAAQQALGFANFVMKRHDLTANSHVSIFDNYSDQSSAGTLQISALIFPIDAVAPPPVKPNSFKTISRTLLRKKKRTRRRSFSGDSEDGGFFEDGNAGGFDGPFGGGSGWGGSGWNFDGFGWQNWDESSSSPSWSDPAMNFVYEVLCWIALSNCVHFAFKKVVRNMAESLREKMPMRLTSVC